MLSSRMSQARLASLMLFLLAPAFASADEKPATDQAGEQGGVFVIRTEVPGTAPGQPLAGGPSWGAEQATGAPNTPAAGDYPTAWASRTPDGQAEWLELTYAEPVEAVAIMVFESYNPGALTRISVFDTSGAEHEAWAGKDPTERTAGEGISAVPNKAAVKFNRLKLHLDSAAVPGWNEIDAVGVIDVTGKTHWAVSATASSSYPEIHASGPPSPFPTPVANAEFEARLRELEQHVKNLQQQLQELQNKSK